MRFKLQKCLSPPQFLKKSLTTKQQHFPHDFQRYHHFARMDLSNLVVVIRHHNYLLREICCSLYENIRLYERRLSKLSITLREWRCGRAEKCVEIRVEQLMNHHYYLEKKVARHDGFAKYRRTCNMHRHTQHLVTMFRKNGMSLVSEFANDCKIRKHLFWHSRNLLTYLPSYQS